MTAPFRISVLLAAPPPFPALTLAAALLVAREAVYQDSRERRDMRALVCAVVSAAVQVSADALVLPAFGCDADRHPPQEVALFFHDALLRAPFQVVLFGIFDRPHHIGDHNPDGNLRPFLRRFRPRALSPRFGVPIQVPPPGRRQAPRSLTRPSEGSDADSDDL